MSAQFAEQPADPRVTPIPRTIGAIRDAFTDDDRRRAFLTAVLAAPLGPALDEVISAAWYEVMSDKVPGHQERLADALSGAHQVPLPELLLVHGE